MAAREPPMSESSSASRRVSHRQKFWPWREENIARVFDSCPPRTYSIDCWDVYIFQRTEYNISAF